MKLFALAKIAVTLLLLMESAWMPLASAECFTHDYQALIDSLFYPRLGPVTQNDLIELLTPSTQFRRYLNEHHLDYDLLSPAAKYRVVGEYTHSSLKRYGAISLAKMRQESLSNALYSLGVEKGRAKGLELLKKVSEENIVKLPVPAADQGMDPEVSVFVSTLQLNPVHNSTIPKKSTSPLLSARQFKKVTNRDGLNTRSEFNKGFMGQSDQVFFFPNFGKKDLYRPATLYGEGVVQYTEPEAEAWVSPYIMNDRDLWIYGREKRSPHADTNNMRALKYEQKNYVFSAIDFEKLIRERLRVALSELKKTEPDTYHDVVTALETNKFPPNSRLGEMMDKEMNKTGHHMTAYPAEYVLKKLVFDPLKMPSRWELKVPVAVPFEKFKMTPNHNPYF